MRGQQETIASQELNRLIYTIHFQPALALDYSIKFDAMRWWKRNRPWLTRP